MALPDPRRYGDGDPHPLLKLADGQHQRELSARLAALAAAGGDAEIRSVLAGASSRSEYAAAWSALCDAVERSREQDAVATRVFALPWVIVCGASAPATLSCVLPDVDEMARVLGRHGVFGPSRNVGLSNALCAIDQLERVAPSAVLRGWEHRAVRDIAPAPIELRRGDQDVHVRFLLGAAVASADAPDIVETGSNVEAWAKDALRSMSAQLATPDVQILPMPRPPAGLYSAAFAGRRAGLEAAFNLFMSNSVRRFRMGVGDPQATLSAHSAGEVRVTLWTPLDDAMVEGFRWPLHPAENVAEIERVIADMIADCRLSEPDVRTSVLADVTATGAILFPTRCCG